MHLLHGVIRAGHSPWRLRDQDITPSCCRPHHGVQPMSEAFLALITRSAYFDTCRIRPQEACLQWDQHSDPYQGAKILRTCFTRHEGEEEVITMLLHYWCDGLPVPCVRKYIHVKGRGVTLPLLMSLLHARKEQQLKSLSRVHCRRGRAYAFESLRALKGSIRLPRT